MQDSSTLHPIPGFPGYYATSEARIFSDHPAGRRNGDGPYHEVKSFVSRTATYPQLAIHVNGKRKTMNLHTLVLSAFSGPRPDGMVCRHLDGNPVNNVPSNLRWGTIRENYLDTVAHGRIKLRPAPAMHGEKHPHAKLTNEQALEIYNRRHEGVSSYAVAPEYGVCVGTVQSIWSGSSWKTVTGAPAVAS